MFRRALPDFLTILTASLIVAAFPPWGFYPLIFVALIPWFYALHRARNLKNAFLQGVWLSFFMTLFGFYWVAYVLKEFGEIPWIAAIAGFLIFCFIGQLQFGVFGFVHSYFSRHRFSERSDRSKYLPHSLVLSLGLAFAYCGIDWILPKLWVDTLGHAFYHARDLRQAADIGGAFLLTFTIYLVNDAIYTLIEKIRQRGEPSYWPAFYFALPQLMLSGGLLLAIAAYGAVRNTEIDKIVVAAPTFKVAVIQGNIGDFDKLASEKGVAGAAKKVLDTFFELSEKALEASPPPEALIWPETSYPSTFRTPQTGDELSRDLSVEQFVKSKNISLLFGGYDHQNAHDYNSFFYLSPTSLQGGSGKSDLQTYHKNILLLFGEYIPGADRYKFIHDAFPQVANFGRGPGPQILSVERKDGSHVLTSPIICYEALFSNYVLEAARKGSQLITNITNDSWFGSFGEPQLHLALTVFRSIESRLPQIRATNTGISAYISATGELVQTTAIGRPEIMSVQVPITPPIFSLIKLWGDWFGMFSFAMGALILGAKRW